MNSALFDAHVVHQDARKSQDIGLHPLPLTARQLDDLHWSSRYHGPESASEAGLQQAQTPKIPRPNTPSSPMEMSTQSAETPGTAPDHGPTEIVQRWNSPAQNKYRMLSCLLLCFSNGMNDSGPGAFIPYLERQYGIGYGITSLIFVSSAIGCISAVFLIDTLVSRLGRSKVMAFSQLLMLVGDLMIVFGPPYPLVVVGFFFIGLSMALNLSMGNVFVSNLANSTTMLGYYHGAYGVGGVVGPLIATLIASSGIQWSYYYFLNIGFTIMNLFLTFWAFKGYESEPAQELLLALDREAEAAEGRSPSKIALLWEAARNRTTLLGSLFIFAYQGAEVSISGWVISFLISYRGGNPAAVGYVTAGFWGGITVGRLTLGRLAQKIGEKRFVVWLTLGAGLLELLVWQVPNIIGDAIAVSIVGLFLGPIYPCNTHILSRLLPKRLQMASFSCVAALGNSGGAVAPFLVGIVAQAAGTWVLHPICIALFVVMEICWFCLPRVEKRRE